MEQLTNAIVINDAVTVTRLLAADPALATRGFQEARLHRSGIFHWIYVGDAPLHLAAAGHRVRILRLLLNAGADPNTAQNHRHSTPLHYAADGFIACPAWDGKDQVDTIRVLLDHGADIHAQDKNGATPLHRAVRTRCAAAVKILLKAGADPKRPNHTGNTSFHLAVQNTGRGGSGAPSAVAAQREIIGTFLSEGVSPGMKNSEGRSVAECARNAWIRELLA
jgi:hypothetical protein